MINSRGHLSAQSLDLLLLKSLSAPEQKSAEAHLESCAECKQRWAELTEDSQKFTQFVFPRTVEKVEARVAPQSIFERFRLAIALPVLGAVAAVIVGVVLTRQTVSTGADEGYIGIKGAGPSLEVFALREGDHLFKVKEGTALKAGDKIRFIVAPGSAKYLLIGSRDPNGAFSVYHPFGAQQSEPIDPQGPRRLEVPGSVELDDSVGQERLYAVFSEAPVTAEQLKQAIPADGQMPQLPGAKVLSWAFVKEAR